MLVANAVEEAVSKGEKSGLSAVPYWRTLKAEGFLNAKYPGGLEGHRRLLQKEGFKIVARGSNCQVADFERYIA